MPPIEEERKESSFTEKISEAKGGIYQRTRDKK
jgi:hypothetical protein